eukprot:2072827-Pyramimonas_sp.AAC.1
MEKQIKKPEQIDIDKLHQRLHVNLDDATGASCQLSGKERFLLSPFLLLLLPVLLLIIILALPSLCFPPLPLPQDMQQFLAKGSVMGEHGQMSGAFEGALANLGGIKALAAKVASAEEADDDEGEAEAADDEETEGGSCSKRKGAGKQEDRPPAKKQKLW